MSHIEYIDLGFCVDSIQNELPRADRERKAELTAVLTRIETAKQTSSRWVDLSSSDEWMREIYRLSSEGKPIHIHGAYRDRNIETVVEILEGCKTPYQVMDETTIDSPGGPSVEYL